MIEENKIYYTCLPSVESENCYDFTPQKPYKVKIKFKKMPAGTVIAGYRFNLKFEINENSNSYCIGNEKDFFDNEIDAQKRYNGLVHYLIADLKNRIKELEESKFK